MVGVGVPFDHFKAGRAEQVFCQGMVVFGAEFGHDKETPGLGAEIKDNPTFSRNFKGKQIFKDGEYVSVNVRKGGARDLNHEVDGISGATVTADGVSEMLYRGIKYYQPYFDRVKDTKSGDLAQ